MVEPTESEDLAEIDRFCEAMIAIRAEIEQVAAGEWTAETSPLRGAPHTSRALAGDWDRAYSREVAVFPTGSDPDKYWPPVGPHRPGLRRPQPGLLLPAARGVRRRSTTRERRRGPHRPAARRAAAARAGSTAGCRRWSAASSGTASSCGRCGRRRGRARARPDVQYRIGSITKTLVAVLVLQLRDEGVLDLDDRLDAHLPGIAVRRPDPARPALARDRHALRAGRLVVGAQPRRRRSTSWRPRSTTDRRRRSRPGATFHYTNLAFGLLGEVVARLRGDAPGGSGASPDPRAARR